MIDTDSYPGAWQEAFARGCLSETVARCRACEQPDCSHPDPIFIGIIPSDGLANAVAPSGVVNGSGGAGFSHPTTSEAR
jgi:hypothetical protein